MSAIFCRTKIIRRVIYCERAVAYKVKLCIGDRSERFALWKGKGEETKWV